MVRQAHTYLVGAMSGATLIAIAIAVFVLLVSAQVFRDWPLAALGGDDSASVSKAKPLGETPAGDSSTAIRAGAGAAAAPRGAQGGADRGSRAGGDGGPAPTATIEAGGGVAGDEGSGSGGGGSGTGAPSGNSGTPARSASNASTGGGHGGGGGSDPGTTTPSTSGKVSETVNDTVNQVDQAVTGGALNEAGVTEVAEGVVNGVAGPESTAGKVVDEAAGAVGGVPGAGH
jgi:hypothetical protein